MGADEGDEVGGAMVVPALPLAISGLTVVESGRPAASIVLPAAPTRGELEAAEALREYFGKISGARPPIVKGKGPQGRAVLVGRAAGRAFDRARRLKRNGFVISNDGRAARVAGRDDLGTVFAAYRLLELLGCRFYAPGELGEVVPRAKTVVVPRVEIVEEPDFEVRGLTPCPPDWALKNGLNVGPLGLDGSAGQAPGPCFERWRFCQAHPADDPRCPLNRAFLERAGEWRRRRGRLLVCDHLLEPRWHGLPWPIVRRLARDFKVYKKLGAVGALLRAGDDWLNLGVRYYVAAKLLWRADADLDALLDDYFSNFYGPAAGPMRAYLERLERAVREAGCLQGDAWAEALRVFKPEVLEYCERCLERAERVARGVYAKRVALARAGFDYACKYVEMLEERDRLVGPWVPFPERRLAFYRLGRLLDELRSAVKAHAGDMAIWSGALTSALLGPLPERVESLRPYSRPVCDLGEERYVERSDASHKGHEILRRRVAINSGLLPYLLEYKVCLDRRGHPGAVLCWPAGGLSGLAVVGPTRANFGPDGALDVIVKGVSLGPYLAEFAEFEKAQFVRLIWRTDAAVVRLIFKEPQDSAALLVSARIWPRGSVGPVEVRLRACPCGLGPPRGRRAVTALREVRAASGGAPPVMNLRTEREFWALLYDSALEAAGESEGPCAFAFPPGKPLSASVEVGSDVVEAGLTYPAGTRVVKFALWEFPALSHEEALSRLKAEVKRALEELERLP